jgi:hypothetical protein
MDGEQQNTDVTAASPFGEPDPPWYKRRVNGAPKPQAVALGIVCGVVAQRDRR